MPLDLAVDAGVRLPPAALSALRARLTRMVRAAALTDGLRAYEVGLRLVGDPAIHALNREFRNKNKPTDVLAFAQREGPAGPLHPSLLGDIVISIDTARRQAKRGLPAELLHLASHGLCHLLGYDHRSDAEERTMNARAASLRAESKRTGRVRPA
ncbi:MAG TPA: rRNA maturation RNase YbeY [Kofleriaceae bacterium]|jgi:probable rRNA maturation factor